MNRMNGVGWFRARGTVLTLFLFTILHALALSGCTNAEQGAKGSVIVFKHGKIAGDPAEFRKVLDGFERENPGIRVKDETLPASTDEQHQFYVINLDSRSADFDVLSLDVIWVPEFARAGWLRDVTGVLSEGERHAFFPGPIRAVTENGKLYAIPWYIDAGVLYYRKDLLKKYGFSVPKTWEELVRTAQEITARERGLYGFLWQGKQYEGLVCNVLEFLWSNGGGVLENGRPVMDSPRNIKALGFMRDLIGKYNVTPPLVTTAIEEPTRNLFGNGKALFLRNWPYAWNLFEQEGSSVRGKVGVAALPSFPGHPSVSTLGGWQLGVNRYSRHPEAAEKLIRFLVSPAVQKTLAVRVGYKPTRTVLYKDPDLVREQPFLASLYRIFMTARPRPVTPYYPMITQVLQPEFSAAITGIKTPEAALGSAQETGRAYSGRAIVMEQEKGSRFVMPAVALLAAVTVYPVLSVLYLSLYRRLPIFDISKFTGLDNYRFLLADDRFWNALGNTAYFTAISVALELLLGISIALLLNRPFRLKGLVIAAVLAPWAIPTVVSARMWEWMYNTDFGILNHVLGMKINWLGSPFWALNAAVFMDVWKTTPFVVILLLAGLKVIPRDLYQAARIDGAGAWPIFTKITLPLLMPVIIVVLIFRTLDAFRVFDAVYVLTGGGPANTTETLSIYAYKVLFQTLQFGYGSTLSVMVFLCTGAITVLYVRFLRAGVRP